MNGIIIYSLEDLKWIVFHIIIAIMVFLFMVKYFLDYYYICET